MTNVVPVSRGKNSEKSKDNIVFSTPAQILNKVEDFNSIVVMSGTATRKSLEKKESHLDVKLVQKNNFKDSILKLRAPFYKSHKQTHTEEKLMTKSCEILLECIRPYKDITVARKTKVTELIQIGNVLKTTNIIYERKATRKVQFFTFSEENQVPRTLNTHPLRFLQTTSSAESENENVEMEDETESSPNLTIQTISSEDFINKVLPPKPSC